VRRLVEEHCRGLVAEEASNSDETLDRVRTNHWDLVVMGLSTDGRGGLELLKAIKALSPTLPVLVFSMRSEEHYARRSFKAGAAGYITKDRSGAELVKAIRKVLGGGRYVSPGLAEMLVADFDPAIDRRPHDSLSDREFEVLRLIASGNTVGEIASLLSLSSRTISTYRARLLEKLALKTNAQVMRYAIENKLVE
jgi:two-component system, NarL family, invasion response regulator UvrY